MVLGPLLYMNLVEISTGHDIFIFFNLTFGRTWTSPLIKALLIGQFMRCFFGESGENVSDQTRDKELGSKNAGTSKAHF